MRNFIVLFNFHLKIQQKKKSNNQYLLKSIMININFMTIKYIFHHKVSEMYF